MTNNTDAYCAALNDAEINLLADMFLSCFELDRTTPGYRRLRNAVILVSRGVNGATNAYKIIADIEHTDKTRVATDVRKTLCALPRPAEQMFDDGYGVTQAKALTLKMPHYDDPDDVVLFLGTLFLYIISSNYGDKYNKGL